MSSFDSRDEVLASPLRARSLLTVRAAISSASSVDDPRSFKESLMCSYWRARFEPFLTPRGGMTNLLSSAVVDGPVTHVCACGKPVGARFDRPPIGNYLREKRRKERQMYIGSGVLVLIVVILLLIWLL
jgi:hypothetical protein